MEIYLIRHTTPQIPKGICYGQSDIPLADSFEKEAKMIKKCLRKDRHSLPVFSSPLFRCRHLAEFLFPHASITVDPRLMELDFGSWEMKAWNAIPPAELNPWMEDFVHVPCPTGESYLDLYNRCMDFLTVLKDQQYRQVIIITHAGPIRAIHARLNGIDLKDSFSLKIAYGEVIRLAN